MIAAGAHASNHSNAATTTVIDASTSSQATQSIWDIEMCRESYPFEKIVFFFLFFYFFIFRDEFHELYVFEEQGNVLIIFSCIHLFSEGPKLM